MHGEWVTILIEWQQHYTHNKISQIFSQFIEVPDCDL